MSQDLTREQRDQILDALKRGAKIEAIKLYRHATGLGLKEAKDFIDALSERLEKEQPGSVTKAKGCGSAAVLIAGIGLAGFFSKFLFR